MAKRAKVRWRRSGSEELPTSKVRGGGWEELPNALGQGQWPRGATPRPRAVAVWVQEGQEELLHNQGQEWWW